MPRRRRIHRAERARRGASGPPRRAHPDWEGSWRLDSSPSRTETGDLAYSPYGATYAGSGAVAFAGHWQDTPDNLDDAPYRLLAPMMNRWLSPDPSGLAAVNPANPQTWNEYAYVANQPLTATDPLGLGTITFKTVVSECITCVGVWQPSPWNLLSPTYWDFMEASMQPPTFQTPSKQTGGSASRGSAATAAAPPWLRPASSQCARPSFSDFVAAHLLGWVASWTGRTIGFGGGASAGIGAGAGATISISRQLVVSPSGSAAWVTTLGGNAFPLGFTMGFGAIGGIQISGSNAANPEQLAGVSGDISLAGGIGDGAASFDYSAGAVSQFTLTGGVGGGAYGAAGGVDLTGVVPICGG